MTITPSGSGFLVEPSTAERATMQRVVTASGRTAAQWLEEVLAGWIAAQAIRFAELDRQSLHRRYQAASASIRTQIESLLPADPG